MILKHTTSGNAANGIGVGISIAAENDNGDEVETAVMDFTLTAVAERLAANVAPPDPFNRRYTTPPGGYPAHRRAARLSYAVWAVVGGQAQPVLDARTTAERLALALRRLEALCDGLAAEGG